MTPDTTPDPAVPQAFQTLGEHYRLQKKLGEGGFGVVYTAHHDLLDQDFAVKVLKPELCEDENTRQRFLDEARALIRFSHPNVVQLRHVGEQKGRLYLVMDLVQGESLDVTLRHQGALPEARAVDIILQVLSGLEAAHAAGIVHRDLKPSNLIVEKRADGRDFVRILDFGLSKLSTVDGMQSAHRSVTGSIIGTLAYMSPEQLAGEKEIDARSDVFAAGLVLHEMLQGQHPYPGESGILVAAKLLREPVPPLDPRRKVSEGTDTALRQALERDRDARFTSAFAFAQTLEGKGPPSDTSRVTTIQSAREALARAESRQAEQDRALRAKTRKKVLVGVAILALAAAGAFFALGPGTGNGEEGDGEVARRDDGAGEGGHRTAPPPPPPPPVTVDPTPDPGPQTPEPPPPPATPPVAPPVAPPPVDPEPSTPPVTPEPVVEPGPEVDPVIPPTPPAPEAPETPEAPEVEPPSPSPPPTVDPTPVPPPGTVPPEESTAIAVELTTAGSWAEASAQWRQNLAANREDVQALRGAATTWLRHADGFARGGDTASALQQLDGLVAWLSRTYSEVYEPGSRTDRERWMLPSGFTLTYRGEAHIERARWYGVQGDAARKEAALSDADSDLRLAWQFLDRDGENYWEFLLRRAELRRLQGQFPRYLEDLELTTQVDSEKVPPHMWIAHAVGLRRKAERLLKPARRPARPGGRRGPARAAARVEAYTAATEALKITRKGESWTRQRGEVFTRAQWLQGARIILTNDVAGPPDLDPTALHGVMKWYVEQARAQPAPAWESEEMAQARLLPLEAGLALLDAKVLARRGQAPKARERFDQALALARRAVALREQIGNAGGELPSAFPYAVLTHILRTRKLLDEALKAWERGLEANLRNPE